MTLVINPRNHGDGPHGFSLKPRGRTSWFFVVHLFNIWYRMNIISDTDGHIINQCYIQYPISR